MRRREDIEIGGYDWPTLILWVILVMVGWFMIFAAGYSDDTTFSTIYDLSYNYGKQFMFIGVGLFLFLIVQLIDVSFFRTVTPLLYGGGLLLLVGVLFTKPINGATSWYSLGGFSLQPSEFAKVSTALMLAYFLSLPNQKGKSLQYKIQASVLIVLPMVLILMQGDAGSTLVFLSLFIVMYAAGLDTWIYILGLIVVALSILALIFDTTWWLINTIVLIANCILFWSNRKDSWLLAFVLIAVSSIYFLFQINIFWATLLNVVLFISVFVWTVIRRNFQQSIMVLSVVVLSSLYTVSVNYIVNQVLKPHQQDRIWMWLRPEKCDPLGPMYNLDQSKSAIGSGGWLGKGFLEGERTKLDYVPEQSTDFIFCTVGEEWGFMGATGIILLFAALIIRILQLARRQRSTFAMYYAYGVASILFFHVFVNIGMTTGLVPVIGIPLPFISYGGSSLMAFSLLMGVLIKFDSNRLYVFR